MTDLSRLNIKLFADGADLQDIGALAANPMIQGFTTNPTLMRAAGVADYAEFAHRMLGLVGDRPVSFEVFADDFDEMERQAREIASWGGNVYVKIPVTNTQSAFTGPLIGHLAGLGIRVNVTALMTVAQVEAVAQCLTDATPAVVSVFAGRIADTGRDPVPMMADAVGVLSARPKAELLWASPREILNIFQADAAGCHIITATRDLLGKLGSIGKDLTAFSLETVEMFHRDAGAAGYTIETKPKVASGE